MTFPSGDGTEVQAWVAVPEGDGPFPTILETHGGPHYTQYEKYDPGAQAWLDHGYAWISVNYRGSVGFGRDFTEQIWGDMGHWELTDMVAAHEWVVREGIARPDEIFAFGASYGGYLTLFALGRRPDLWAGGMAIVAEADLAASYAEVSDALRAAMRGWMRGSPEDRPEAWARSSPITYAADFAAPVLAIQARNDSRIGVDADGELRTAHAGARQGDRAGLARRRPPVVRPGHDDLLLGEDAGVRRRRAHPETGVAPPAAKY